MKHTPVYRARWVITFLLLVGAVCPLSPFADAAETKQSKFHVLILTGANNHDWQATTPVLRDILEAEGMRVSVTESPETLTAKDLREVDVLLSNWNQRDRTRKPDWPLFVRRLVLDFVREGKGFVVVHAGSSSFPTWTEYHRLTGAAWENGQTSHGRPHTFTVNIRDPNHPVTRGMADFETTDELWLKPGLQENATVLAVAEGEPVALTTAFGQGRGFTLLLGHDATFMENQGFRLLLQRGTQWAATGRVEER